MDLRRKILFIGVAELVIVVAVLFGFYYVQARDTIREQYVAKARSIILTAESAHEEMAK